MESLTSYMWPSNSQSTEPIHVCQENRSRTSTIMCWALRPFGLHNIPLDVSKTEEKTIVKIETEQTRIVDGVKRLASLFNFQTEVPFKIETDGARSIITMELTKWIFCDCDFKKNKQLPKLTEEGTEEDEEDEELFKKIFSNGKEV